MPDFPVALTGAVDTVTEILAIHLNNLEAKVGIDASAVVTSLDYLLKNAASVDPGHKHSKLWASDGDPEAVTVDADGQMQINASLIVAGNTYAGEDGLALLFAPLIPSASIQSVLSYEYIPLIIDGSPILLGSNAAGNVGIGVSAFGTSAVKVLGLGSGTAPTTAPADMAQMWVEDINAAAGKAGFHMMSESGVGKLIVSGCVIKATTGNPAQVHENLWCINTFDHTIKLYAEAAWKTIYPADHTLLTNIGTNTHAQIDTFIGTKAQASGLASLNASTVVVEAVGRLLAGTGALTATEGYFQWQSTRKLGLIYDGAREKAVTDLGWMPYAYPVSFNPTSAFTTALALAAAGGSIAIPIWLDGHMLLQSVSVRNTDATLARTWGWDLYEDRHNDNNTLNRVAACSADDSFTAAAASTRTLDAGSAPVYLGPGLYWLVIQCRHATSTFGLGSTAASAAFALNTAQTKTTSNPNGATLDFVAATWTKTTATYAVRLNGRVFAGAAAF